MNRGAALALVCAAQFVLQLDFSVGERRSSGDAQITGDPARPAAMARHRLRTKLHGMMGGAKAHYDGIVAFSQTDFTDDLGRITVPTLVMRGDDDQVVLYADCAPLSHKLVKNSRLKTYKGYPHGMPTTNADVINADMLAFIETVVPVPA
jgi:pimeloyl-ACP methyl ester carboxylesterase